MYKYDSHRWTSEKKLEGCHNQAHNKKKDKLKISNSSQTYQRLQVTGQTSCPPEVKRQAKTEKHSLTGAETTSGASSWRKNVKGD